MNGVLDHFCAHIGRTGPGETPEDVEMNEMALLSRHRIWNASPGDLGPSTLPLGHEGSKNIESMRVSGGETYLFFKLECQSVVRTRDRRLSQQAALSTAPLIKDGIVHRSWCSTPFLIVKTSLPMIVVKEKPSLNSVVLGHCLAFVRGSSPDVKQHSINRCCFNVGRRDSKIIGSISRVCPLPAVSLMWFLAVKNASTSYRSN